MRYGVLLAGIASVHASVVACPWEGDILSKHENNEGKVVNFDAVKGGRNASKGVCYYVQLEKLFFFKWKSNTKIANFSFKFC